MATTALLALTPLLLAAAAPIPKPAPSSASISLPPRPQREIVQRSAAAAPAALSAAKRAKLVSAAAKRLGLPNLANATLKLDWRLTPMQLELENGARIISAYNADFAAKSNEVPGGYYWLRGDMDYSVVRMDFPTEVGAVYAVDCRGRKHTRKSGEGSKWSYGGVYFEVSGYDDWAEIHSVEGHLMHLFVAKETTTELGVIWWDVEPEDEKHAYVWYGCDIGKFGS